MRLAIIPTEALAVDPDVQLDYALDPKRVAKIAANYDPALVHVLTVVPASRNGKQPSQWWIVDGRHRFLAGSTLGIREWRCDVHDDITTPAEKARLKLGLDRERRNVSALEHFAEREIAGDPAAVAIADIVHSHGYTIGRMAHNEAAIEGVVALEAIYARHGADGLRRTLALATTWRLDPKGRTAVWLSALSLLIADNVDNRLTPVQWERLRSLVPAEIIRQARGNVAVSGAASSNPSTNWEGTIATAVAAILRKRARLRPAKAE